MRNGDKRTKILGAIWGSTRRFERIWQFVRVEFPRDFEIRPVVKTVSSSTPAASTNLRVRPARQVAHEHLAGIAGIKVVADVVFSIARFALALLAPVVVAVTDVLLTIAAYG